jgi:tRNA threonylcarbamoyladenosine biosynthesis protein TsaB
LRVLAIDTALLACSACVFDGATDSELTAESTLMERGHAEALMPMIQRVAGAVDGGFASIDRISVTVGPGSFTGLRVGIAAARAIALGLGVPAVGVTTLSAFASPAIGSREARVIVAAVIDARHGQVYLQMFGPGGRTLVSPRIVGLRDAVRLIGAGPVKLTGSGAELLLPEARLAGLEIALCDPLPGPDISWVARLGLAANPEAARPVPLYLKPPDAQPQQQGRIARR